MAQVFPILSELELVRLQSRAEAKFYEACRDQLSDRFFVLYSVPFIRPGSRGQHLDGEADFVIFDREGGFVIVEVKGGGVFIDSSTGKWVSRDFQGRKHGIKNPFVQATKAKYSIMSAVLGHSGWPGTGIDRLGTGHAVAFPDLDDVTALVGTERPSEILGSKHDVASLETWLDGVSAFWRADDTRAEPLESRGMEVVRDLFSREISVQPLLRDRFELEETERIRLTEEQGRVLRTIGLYHRAAISGGAGTGKTLLALQKAREVAEAGHRTLFLCFNRALANHVSEVAKDIENLSVMTFHQYCDFQVRSVRESTGRDTLLEAHSAYAGGNHFQVHLPYACTLAVEESGFRYESIIVDEGQDFSAEFWPTVELSLEDHETSHLYVFYDPNQAIYGTAATFPISERPLMLTRNCRNTRAIHNAFSRFYSGYEIEPPTIDGEGVMVIGGSSVDGQAASIHAWISEMVDAQKLKPREIAVLVGDNVRKTRYYDALGSRLLPSGAGYQVEKYDLAGGVIVDTVHRFKGLEAMVVFLWGLESTAWRESLELPYVGMSRAKSALILVGDETKCQEMLAYDRGEA